MTEKVEATAEPTPEEDPLVTALAAERIRTTGRIVSDIVQKALPNASEATAMLAGMLVGASMSAGWSREVCLGLVGRLWDRHEKS